MSVFFMSEPSYSCCDSEEFWTELIKLEARTTIKVFLFCQAVVFIISSNWSMYSRLLDKRGTLCCPPSFPFCFIQS